MLKLILLSVSTAFLASQVYAQGFEGQVTIRNGQAYIQADANSAEPWKLDALSDEVKVQLSSLDDGDFLSATGELHKMNHTAYVETVDFVGLKRILGRWVSKDGYSIDFMDFRSAVVEQRQQLPWNPKDQRKVDVVYTILPLKASNWSLLMSNRKTVRVGTLSIADKLLSIQLVDQATGRISEDISLSQQP